MIELNYPQKSEDWLRARCGVITASRFSDAIDTVGALDEKQSKFVKLVQGGMGDREAAILAGYKTPPRSDLITRALAGEKTEVPSYKADAYAWLLAFEAISREPLDETYVTYAMRRGIELEPIARKHYEIRTGQMVREVSLILTDDEVFGYSSDGLVGDDGMVEIKCPLNCEKIGKVWQEPEQAHLEYLNQIDGGLWISDRKWCDLIVYCDWLAPVGKDLFVKRIYRNDDRIEELESRLWPFKLLVDERLNMLRAPLKMSGRPIVDLSPGPVVDVEPKPAARPAPLRTNLFPEDNTL